MKGELLRQRCIGKGTLVRYLGGGDVGAVETKAKGRERWRERGKIEVREA